LHFQTKTTIDTLDYSGTGWNAGSKVIVACCGDKRRELSAELPVDLSLPAGFSNPKFVQPGILAIQGPAFAGEASYEEPETLANHLRPFDWSGIPMIVLCDDSGFLSGPVNNFLWAAFTRANPSHDIHGVDAFVEHKHWGCRGPVIIDARIKPHHAPPLITDKEAEAKADRFFKKGGVLEKWG
jgi:4-hydroxy-3-polyprenylbenzoate decarboxylase